MLFYSYTHYHSIKCLAKFNNKETVSYPRTTAHKPIFSGKTIHYHFIILNFPSKQNVLKS
ncbi:hypothetical protein EMIT040CA3_310120 [Bacillus pseudomycoides]